MAKFDPSTAKKAFNRAVDAHKKHGGNPTQVRPKIKSIGPPRGDEARLLLYANGSASMQAEQDIAAIVHSYSALVAMIAGDASLIAWPYWMEQVPIRALTSGALSPYATMVIQMFLPVLLATIKNKKTRASVKAVWEQIHAAGVAGFGTKSCEEATGK